MRRGLTVMGAAVLVAWALNAASAHDASDLPAGPIRDRHELMEGIGKNAKIINEALKKGDVSPVADAADKIQSLLPFLDECVAEGMITIESVRVLKYRGQGA